MFSKQEASRLRQEFWTVFGQYMSPVQTADQEKANWINYKTGVKDIFFRMHADQKQAWIAIEVAHKDDGLQQIYFEQLQQFRNLLRNTTGEEWHWQMHVLNEHGKKVSRAIRTIEGLNIYKKQDWPALISFFKPRLIALDSFWSDVKYAFELLG
jgi:hypothetical protein